MSEVDVALSEDESKLLESLERLHYINRCVISAMLNQIVSDIDDQFVSPSDPERAQ